MGVAVPGGRLLALDAKTSALIEHGMPRLEMLSDTEARQHLAYMRARAREALDTREPDSLATSLVRL